MARVNVDQHALTDARFDRLAELRGWADADHARGKMLRIWNECVHRGSALPVWLIEHQLGAGAAGDLLECQLAELVSLAGEVAGIAAGGSLVRIKGTEGRTDWYQKKVNAAQLGGKARAASAQRVAGRFTSQRDQPLAGGDTSAPAPAPAPAPVLKEEEDLSGKPDDPALLIARTAVAEINRLTGQNFKPESKSVTKLCKALAREKYTPEEAIAVVASRRSWLTDDKMRKHFVPDTLLRLSNFEKYLDQVAASKPKARPTSTAPAVDDFEPMPVWSEKS